MRALRLVVLLVVLACLHASALAVGTIPFLAQIVDSQPVDVASSGSLVYFATSEAVYIYEVGPAGQSQFRSRYVPQHAPILGVEAMTGWLFVLYGSDFEIVNVSSPSSPVLSRNGNIAFVQCLTCDEANERLYVGLWFEGVGNLAAFTTDGLPNLGYIGSCTVSAQPYTLSAGYNDTLEHLCCIVGAAGDLQYYQTSGATFGKLGHVATEGITRAVVCDTTPVVVAADANHFHKISFQNPAAPSSNSPFANSAVKRDVVFNAGVPRILISSGGAPPGYDVWSYATATPHYEFGAPNREAYALATPVYAGTTYLALALSDRFECQTTAGSLIQIFGLLNDPFQVVASRTRGDVAYALTANGLFTLKLLSSPYRIVVTNVYTQPYAQLLGMTAVGSSHLVVTKRGWGNGWVGRSVLDLSSPENPQDIAGSMGAFFPTDYSQYMMAGDDSHWGVYGQFHPSSKKFEFRAFRSGSDSSLLQGFLDITPSDVAIEWPRIYLADQSSNALEVFWGENVRRGLMPVLSISHLTGIVGARLAASGDYLFATDFDSPISTYRVMPGYLVTGLSTSIPVPAGYGWLKLTTCGPYLFTSSYNPSSSWTKLQSYTLYGLPSSAPALADEAMISGPVSVFDVNAGGLVVAVNNMQTVALYSATPPSMRRVACDIDGDGEVTLDDLARFFQWTRYCKLGSNDPSLASDLDGDGDLDHVDYRLMAETYLTGGF